MSNKLISISYSKQDVLIWRIKHSSTISTRIFSVLHLWVNLYHRQLFLLDFSKSHFLRRLLSDLILCLNTSRHQTLLSIFTTFLSSDQTSRCTPHILLRAQFSIQVSTNKKAPSSLSPNPCCQICLFSACLIHQGKPMYLTSKKWHQTARNTALLSKPKTSNMEINAQIQCLSQKEYQKIMIFNLHSLMWFLGLK